MVKFFLQMITDPNIFDEELRIVLLGIPSRIPGLDESQSKTDWMHFLSQVLPSFTPLDGALTLPSLPVAGRNKE
jgi:hypothetical protein